MRASILAVELLCLAHSAVWATKTSGLRKLQNLNDKTRSNARELTGMQGKGKPTGKPKPSPVSSAVPSVAPSVAPSAVEALSLAPSEMPSMAPVMDDSEPPLPDNEILISWYQCTNDPICDLARGSGSPKDCGFPGIPKFECPLGEACDVLCVAQEKFCYNRTSDSCGQSCYTDSCPDGLECIEQNSFECGTRVCKNTTVAFDFEACTTTQCTNSTDCNDSGNSPEMECVSYYQDCGIGI